MQAYAGRAFSCPQVCNAALHEQNEPEEDVEALIKKYGEVAGKEVDRGDAIKVGDLQLVAGPNTMPEPALLEFVNMIGHEHKKKADATASAIEPPARG